MVAVTKAGAAKFTKRRTSTVDSYKAEHGKDCFYGFWNTSSLAKGIVETSSDLHVILLDTVEKLNEIYIPFAWWWVKERRPKIREQVIDIETEIIVAVQCDNEESLRDALKRYYDIWLEAIIEFSTQDKYTPF